MPCGTTRTGTNFGGTRNFGQGAGWRFRVFPRGLGLTCPPNALPQGKCEIDFTPPVVTGNTAQLTPMMALTVFLSVKVTGVQTGPNSCNVRVFRKDGTQVPGTVVYDGVTTVTFTPSANYCAGSGAQNVSLVVGSDPFTAPLCPGIKDSCGNRLAQRTILIPVTGC